MVTDLDYEKEQLVTITTMLHVPLKKNSRKRCSKQKKKCLIMHIVMVLV